MWPNIFAPSFWTILGITLAHLHNLKRLKKHDEKLDQHNDMMDPNTPGGITIVLEEIRNNNAGTQSRAVDKEAQDV